VSFLSGPPLATYTGAQIANTAIPVWSEARDELPWLFGASAVASAGAASLIVTPPEAAGPARRSTLAGVVAELGLMQTMETKLGFLGEVYKQGEAGRYGRLSKALTAGGAALVAGELALRWSVFKAGFQSARDPKYTVLLQKERIRKRKGVGS
jgi:formate-dependent nitrite reductase membrane component NrfD